MLALLKSVIWSLFRRVVAGSSVVSENGALRHQVHVPRSQLRPPKLTRRDRQLFAALCTAAEWAGTIGAVGAVWLGSASALAYHDTIHSGRGGAPLEVILPIVGAVALGIIALAVFSRKTRKTKVKARSQKRRATSRVRKRR